MGNKLEILRKKSDFDFIRKNGKRIYPCDWMIISYVPNELNKTRCGWVVSRKIGNAVTRNKFRRWMREALKTILKNEVKSVDINVIIREKNEKFFKDRKYGDFTEQLSKAWSKIR